MSASADVVVVGGGLVGALTALLLGAQGRRVVLLERAEPQRQRGELGVDVRNVAVSPASQALLEQAGVWQALGPAPYQRMCVWEERGTGQLEFTAAQVGRAELGWICEHSEVVCALWTALAAMDNVELRVGEEVEAVAVAEDAVTLTLPSATVVARLLIAADGSRSGVRAALGVPVTEKPTGHHALATVVRLEHGHGGVAWQRFLLDGPLAVLPSREPHLASIVWSQPAQQAERRAGQDAAEFAVELEGCLERRLGGVLTVDRRLVFPVSQMLVDSFNPEPRVLLVGDAARSIHPLAGLGANVGFEDVRELVANVRDVGAGEDLGAAGLWKSFAWQRRARAQMILALMTGLRRVYSEPGPLATLLRNTGVAWLDRSGPLKQQFIREALGLGPLAQGLGPLARGVDAIAHRW